MEFCLALDLLHKSRISQIECVAKWPVGKQLFPRKVLYDLADYKSVTPV